VYQGQKVYLFRSSLSFVAEAQPRLENRRGQKALFGRGAHYISLATARTTKQDIIGKITNLFCINKWHIWYTLNTQHCNLEAKRIRSFFALFYYFCISVMTFKAEPNVHIAHVGTNILKIKRNVRMSNDITNCKNISFFNDHFDK
jgi:hypothetical protein